MLDRTVFAATLVTLCAVGGGCANYKPPAVFAGSMSPPMARTACIDAVVREFKVPKEGVTPTSDTQSMREGFYVVTLDVGDGRPPVNCTVNENGVVSDVIRAR